MVKAKLAESTVVLAVAKGPTNFDTSPAALIELKNLGVSAVFIDAMLRSGDRPTEKNFEGKTDKTSRAASSTAASGWTVTTSVSPTGGTKTLILCCSKVFLV